MDTLLPGISPERVLTSRLTRRPPVQRLISGYAGRGGRGDFGVRRPAHWAA